MTVEELAIELFVHYSEVQVLTDQLIELEPRHRVLQQTRPGPEDLTAEAEFLIREQLADEGGEAQA